MRATRALLPHASVTEVRGYIEQLTGLGLLQQAGNEYPVLALTPNGDPQPLLTRAGLRARS